MESIPKEESLDNNNVETPQPSVPVKPVLINEDGYNIELIGNEYKEYDYTYKFILIGDSGVGKSCISLKLTKDTFQEDFLSTIGFEFLSFFMKINGEVIKIQIWDTCGQEAYRSLISNFFRNTSVAIIVYSITE